MTTLEKNYKETVDAFLGSAIFVVLPSIIGSVVSSSYAGVNGVAIIIVVMLLWSVAILAAYGDLEKGTKKFAVANIVTLVLSTVYLAKFGGATQVARSLTWLAEILIVAHIAAIFFIKKKAVVGQQPKLAAAGTNGQGFDEAFYLREETKMIERGIAQGKYPAKPNHQYQHKAELTKVNFKSITGMEALKKRLYAAHQESFAAVTTEGADKKNGILLYGEPGNGKTFFAEALAGQMGWPLIKCTFGDVNSRWVGATTENVVQIFDDAMAQTPCVLFIDEIDALLVKRDQITQAESETGKTVNTILTKLVEIREHMVLVVAATNSVG